MSLLRSQLHRRGVLAFFYQAEDRLFELAEAMHREYKTLTDAGALVQLDSPDLLMVGPFLKFTKEKYIEYQRLHVEALNKSIDGISKDKLALHACYGNYIGPHNEDFPLVDLLPQIYEAKVGTYVLELANPRHRADWTAFKEHPLPDGKKLAAGVIDVKTPIVETPEAVKQSLCRFVDEGIVKPENLLGAPDCGFGTFAGLRNVSYKVTKLKLRSLVKEAALASKLYE